MESKLDISINQTWHPVFKEILDTVRCFDSSPGTPNIAALMSLVFETTNQKESQKRLGEWLVHYIEPFLLNQIRDEQNLQGKTLAIASYLFISSKIDLGQKLSDELLINYLEYASEQLWFDDNFLAFYCHFIKDQIMACRNIENHFQQSYERVLAKKNIPAISQSLIVLNKVISNTDRNRGYEILASLLDQNISVSHSAWALWAFSLKEEARSPLETELAASIEDKIENNIFLLNKESGIGGLLTLASVGAGQAQMQEYLDNITNPQSYKKVNILLNSDTVISLDTSPITNLPSAELISVFDLGLALLGLSHAKYDRVVYVSGSDANDLNKIANRIKRLANNGGIDLSRPEQSVLNALVVFVISLIVLAVFYFQLGGTLSFDFSKLSISNWSLDKIVIFIPFLDYLLGIIQSIHTDANAVKGLLKLPLIRHWQEIQRTKRKNRK